MLTAFTITLIVAQVAVGLPMIHVEKTKQIS